MSYTYKVTFNNKSGNKMLVDYDFSDSVKFIKISAMRATICVVR